MPNALVLAETGGPENFRLEPQEPPPVGPGQLLVRNEAIGLNFIDIYQRKGLYPVTTPAILGSEGAGIIEAVGDGVEGFSKGDRVAYLTGSGAYAELIAVPAAMAATIPDSLPSDVAASVFLKGLTAEMLLKRVFPIEAGQSCLVYAAVGGVGTLLCQWAHHLGATVIAVVGSEEKAERARNLGADCVINRKTAENIATAARAAIGGGGVNVVYDSVGAATFEASLDALAPLGMMVTYGNASGPAPPIEPLELSRRGSLSLIRPSLFHYATPDRLPAMAAALFDVIANGAVTPSTPASFPLKDGADAHRLLESGDSAGSIILTP